MIAETVILLALHLPLPPTWINLPAVETMRPILPLHNPQDITPSLATALPRTTDYPVDYSSGDRATFLSVQSPYDARRSATVKLANRVSAYRVEIEDDVNAGQPPRSNVAIGHVLSIIEAIPDGIPLPRPMLLLSGVSLFWEFGEVYAEIAVADDGAVAVYAKRPGREELLLDTDMNALRATAGVFPAQLKTMLLPT